MAKYLGTDRVEVPKKFMKVHERFIKVEKKIYKGSQKFYKRSQSFMIFGRWFKKGYKG